jgi:hypothetical protein
MDCRPFVGKEIRAEGPAFCEQGEQPSARSAAFPAEWRPSAKRTVDCCVSPFTSAPWRTILRAPAGC